MCEALLVLAITEIILSNRIEHYHPLQNWQSSADGNALMTSGIGMDSQVAPDVVPSPVNSPLTNISSLLIILPSPLGGG